MKVFYKQYLNRRATHSHFHRRQLDPPSCGYIMRDGYSVCTLPPDHGGEHRWKKSDIADRKAGKGDFATNGVER